MLEATFEELLLLFSSPILISFFEALMIFYVMLIPIKAYLLICASFSKFGAIMG
jgi:hypothetical protein